MDARSLLEALLAGLVCGFVVSIPVGPVNLTVINQALRRGFLGAFLVGAGAVVAETGYATVLMAGHTALLNKPLVSNVLRVTAVLVMAAIGVRSLLFKEERFEASDTAQVERVTERWHHPRAFLLGFLLTISNLMLVVLWATLAALLFARDWVQPSLISRLLCSAGVLSGGMLWFFLLATFVSRAQRRVNSRTLTFLVRGCGLVFLGFAVLLAVKLFRS